jgi:hypothetical protein
VKTKRQAAESRPETPETIVEGSETPPEGSETSSEAFSLDCETVWGDFQGFPAAPEGVGVGFEGSSRGAERFSLVCEILDRGCEQSVDRPHRVSLGLAFVGRPQCLPGGRQPAARATAGNHGGLPLRKGSLGWEILGWDERVALVGRTHRVPLDIASVGAGPRACPAGGGPHSGPPRATTGGCPYGRVLSVGRSSVGMRGVALVCRTHRVPLDIAFVGAGPRACPAGASPRRGPGLLPGLRAKLQNLHGSTCF